MIEKNELVENINGINIFYKYKKRKYDCNHLIFIFSGFGGEQGVTYDFENALDHCPAHIVWVKDFFEEACSYYWCVNMNFSYEEAVSAFIDKKMKEFNLSNKNITLAGFSKGGSAALYYGIKHNISNIVASAPQLFVASYAANNWGRIARHMMGKITPDKIATIDNKIISSLDKDKNTNKNIYLLTSEKDIQFPTEIHPNLIKFIKYKNFNLLMSKSLLVNEHKQITQYHVPLLLGIFYSLSQGATPHYGHQELCSDPQIGAFPRKAEPVTILRKYKFDKSLFFPEGLAYLKGCTLEKYSDIKSILILKSQNTEYKFPLAKDHKPNLTKDLYTGEYINYDKAWFCTLKYSGIDLSSLPRKETFELFINLENKVFNTTSSVVINQYTKNILVLDENPFFKLYSINAKVYLLKK